MGINIHPQPLRAIGSSEPEAYPSPVKGEEKGVVPRQGGGERVVFLRRRKRVVGLCPLTREAEKGYLN